jgi:hypothetical protein
MQKNLSSTNTLAFSAASTVTKKKGLNTIDTSGLYYKHITIVNVMDDHKSQVTIVSEKL